MKKQLVIFILLTTLFSSVRAQDYQKDVVSEDAIIKALYEVISGDSGQVRNWERFEFLFAKDARLIPTTKTPDSNYSYRIITPAEYAQRMGSRNPGFYEYELARKTESFGTVTHIFTTYATKFLKDGPVTNRGINSIQLLKDKNRFYIMNIFWCGEDSGFSLPKKYLK